MKQRLEPGLLLRIFISENERHEGRPLADWIVRRALEEGLAGATVLRGLQGFGGHRQVRSAHILALSDDLPLVVEIVDREARIEAFLPQLAEAVPEGLITLEKVQYRLCRQDSDRASS
ncbi:MAG: DUF190 domain-containing protein [Acidobacteriota bacterium]|nr:DUF190 domain-containing protein [Acidobacteriota bacterium]